MEENKTLVIVGGTGLYTKALTEKIQTVGIKPDLKLREKLQGCRVVELQRKLKRFSKKRWRKMNKSDRANPRRLIRAIEIARGEKKQKTQAGNYLLKFNDCLVFGLKAPNEFLYQRIDQRV